MNSAAALKAAGEADAALPEGLYEACLNTGRTPTPGEVKMIYCTKVRLCEYAIINIIPLAVESAVLDAHTVFPHALQLSGSAVELLVDVHSTAELAVRADCY